MQTSIDILNELKELSPFLAGMEKINVFTVPDGYFEELADQLLSFSGGGESAFFSEISKQQQQEVPPGYFDNLAESIMTKIRAAENITAADELQTLSPALYGIQNKNVFEVPLGYFESLGDMIFAKIHNHANITAAQELRTLSPMLYSVQNENVFEVPKGYFAELPGDILTKVKPAKLVTMRRRSSSFIKYAVAAAFTGMMALGIFKFTGTQVQSFRALPNYVVDGLKPHDIDQELANVSDVEIEKYLESTGTDVKSALVANSVDESTLPSQDDYLLDEKTLDNYLNSINANDLKN